MFMFLRSSIGSTILPSSSIFRVMPVAFIFNTTLSIKPPAINCGFFAHNRTAVFVRSFSVEITVDYSTIISLYGKCCRMVCVKCM
jgi:hypothetical protein